MERATTQSSGGLKTWLVMAVALFASLGLAEVLLRTTAPIHLTGILQAYHYDDEVGYLLKPDIHMLKTTDHLQEIRTNPLGTLNFEEDFSGYAATLFAIGDSFTAGTGLPSDASYPFQLTMILNAIDDGAFRKNVAVINLGLAAFGMEQSLLILRRYREKISNPNGILLLGCDNDLRDDLLFRSGYRHRHLVDGSPFWGGLVVPLQWASNFELVKRTKLALATSRTTLAARSGEHEGRPSDVSVAEAEWPIIDRIIRDASQNGSFVILGWANGESESYEWLRDAARQRGIPFADWYPRARAILDAMPTLSMQNPHSAGHWRTWVNRLIAEEYARQVRAQLH